MSEELIIQLVRAHPCLYNTEDENYRNIKLKEELWNNIASNLGKSGKYRRVDFVAMYTSVESRRGRATLVERWFSQDMLLVSFVFGVVRAIRALRDIELEIIK